MPIYEYRCAECGHRLESLQRLSDAPLVVCPACGKQSLTKLVSAAGFQLKGSGWYATDFKHSGAKPPEKTPAKADAGKESSGGEKGEGAAAAASSNEPKSAPASAGSESKTSTTAPSATSAPPAKPAATGS